MTLRLTLRASVTRLPDAYFAMQLVSIGLRIAAVLFMKLLDMGGSSIAEANVMLTELVDRLQVEVSACDADLAALQPQLETDFTGADPAIPFERAVLMRALMRFLTHTLKRPQLAERVRTLMDGSLPASIVRIICQPNYFGHWLFAAGKEHALRTRTRVRPAADATHRRRGNPRGQRCR